MCCDPYRLDVAGGGTVFSRARFGDWSTGVVATPKPTVTEDETDRSRPIPTPREIPTHTGLVSVLVFSFGN